jgi:hypothetical protein
MRHSDARLGIAMACALISSSPQVRGAEPAISPGIRYYAVIFAYQNASAAPQKTHTWATFVKVGPEDGPKTLPALERHTISWLPTEFPQTLRMSLVASPGRNYSLSETLHLAARQGLPVRHWGPYEIDESLYVRALSQVAFLNSGRVRYKLVEPIRRRRAFLRTGGALHCTHAVTDLHGFVVTGFARGYAAGSLAAELFADDLRGSDPNWLFGRVVHGD